MITILILRISKSINKQNTKIIKFIMKAKKIICIIIIIKINNIIIYNVQANQNFKNVFI